MTVFLFIICVLAVWRIARLLHFEDGPYSIFDSIRIISRKYTSMFDCFLCLSVWVALPFSLLFDYWFIVWFSLSAGAVLIEEWSDSKDN